MTAYIAVPSRRAGSGSTAAPSRALASEPSRTLATCTPVLTENFDNIATLGPAGWAIFQNSQPLGATGWFQGDSSVFPSQAGAPNAYISADFDNTVGPGGTISNWLITPVLTLHNGDVLSFYTRTVAVPQFPDRLEVRMSTNGASIDVGTTATSVGDFTTVLLTINPTLSTAPYPTGYPNDWTLIEATVNGLGGATAGRLAFRYFVTDAGDGSPNSDTIGIDTVIYGTNCIASGAYNTVAPCRAIDTRAADAPALAGGTDRTFTIVGKCGVPAAAKGRFHQRDRHVAHGQRRPAPLSDDVAARFDDQLRRRADARQQRDHGIERRRAVHRSNRHAGREVRPLHRGRQRLLPVAADGTGSSAGQESERHLRVAGGHAGTRPRQLIASDASERAGTSAHRGVGIQ
jgi:hypothetical protein